LAIFHILSSCYRALSRFIFALLVKSGLGVGCSSVCHLLSVVWISMVSFWRPVACCSPSYVAILRICICAVYVRHHVYSPLYTLPISLLQASCISCSIALYNASFRSQTSWYRWTSLCMIWSPLFTLLLVHRLECSPSPFKALSRLVLHCSGAIHISVLSECLREFRPNPWGTPAFHTEQ